MNASATVLENHKIIQMKNLWLRSQYAWRERNNSGDSMNHKNDIVKIQLKLVKEVTKSYLRGT